MRLYKDCGILGFFKGITASYFGIIETVIYFLFYEFIKNKIAEHRWEKYGRYYETPGLCFVQSMAAGATSRIVASLSFYPHGKYESFQNKQELNRSCYQSNSCFFFSTAEVVRTRLRQPDDKYKGFFKTLFRVYHEEGMPSLYRGLGTHLMRQIPNTAIMMGKLDY